MTSSVIFIHITVGLIILLMGRRLFWLFVMVAGFFVGAELAGDLLSDYPRWLAWGTAVLAGLAGALLAAILQRAAFVVAGFFGGSYLAIILMQSFSWTISQAAVSIVGGLGGAVFAALAMDWAIIILSSLAGSGIIVAALGLQSTIGLLTGGVLASLGIILQAAQLGQSPDKPAGG